MELEGIYNSVDSETCSKCNERGLDRDEDIYANNDRKLSQSESRAQKHSKTFSVILVVYIEYQWFSTYVLDFFTFWF